MVWPVIEPQKLSCSQCGILGDLTAAKWPSGPWHVACKVCGLHQPHVPGDLLWALRDLWYLAEAYATDEEDRSRDQRWRILQDRAHHNAKVCSWCWSAKPRNVRHYALKPRNRDGLDGHCRECRRILDRLHTYERDRVEMTVEERAIYATSRVFS